MFPDAKRKIAYDKFHVARWLNRTIDQVRRGEHRQLHAAGDNRVRRSKYQWIRNPHSMNRRRWNDFRALRGSTLATARAWALKETAKGRWTYVRRGWAERARKARLG